MCWISPLFTRQYQIPRGLWKQANSTAWLSFRILRKTVVPRNKTLPYPSWWDLATPVWNFGFSCLRWTCLIMLSKFHLLQFEVRVFLGALMWSIQESLANANGSARQPWYIVRNSINRPHLGSPSNINVIYTSLKSTFSAQQFARWQYGSIFIRFAVVASQTCQLAQNSTKIWTYGSSRSSKVDDFDTNRKGICHFLLVINSNFGPILHRFWDAATY